MKHVNAYRTGPKRSQSKYAAEEKIPITTFCKWVREFDEGKLKLNEAGTNANSMKQRSSLYDPIAQDLVSYIRLRREEHPLDKHGLTWASLQDQALKLASNHLSKEQLGDFKASSGWIDTVLKKNNLLGLTALHGEGKELHDEGDVEGDDLVQDVMVDEEAIEVLEKAESDSEGESERDAMEPDYQHDELHKEEGMKEESVKNAPTNAEVQSALLVLKRHSEAINSEAMATLVTRLEHLHREYESTRPRTQVTLHSFFNS